MKLNVIVKLGIKKKEGGKPNWLERKGFKGRT